MGYLSHYHIFYLRTIGRFFWRNLIAYHPELPFRLFWSWTNYLLQKLHLTRVPIGIHPSLENPSTTMKVLPGTLVHLPEREECPLHLHLSGGGPIHHHQEEAKEVRSQGRVKLRRDHRLIQRMLRLLWLIKIRHQQRILSSLSWRFHRINQHHPRQRSLPALYQWWHSPSKPRWFPKICQL